MRILRGMHAITVASFFILAVATSSIFIVLTPRTTHAEGPLLGTVRCLLETVLLQKCTPVAPVGEEASNPSAPAKPTSTTSKGSGNSSSGGSSSGPAQPSTKQANASSGQPITSGGGAVASEPADIPLPKETAPMAPAVQGASTIYPSQATMTKAERLAFFNTYGPYARDTQLQQVSATPLETSTEGWKFMGMAWYWWAMIGLLGVVVVTSIKRLNLRQASGLSDKGESAKVEKNT